MSKKLYTALEYFDIYFEILKNLKDDKDKYIQKSVANNLNDLYKEDQDKFYKIINEWKRENISKECEWIIKHGSRNIHKNFLIEIRINIIGCCNTTRRGCK